MRIGGRNALVRIGLVDGGFGSGPFTLRITGMDGQVLTETLPGFSPGQIITSTVQFQ